MTDWDPRDTPANPHDGDDWLIQFDDSTVMTSIDVVEFLEDHEFVETIATSRSVADDVSGLDGCFTVEALPGSVFEVDGADDTDLRQRPRTEPA